MGSNQSHRHLEQDGYKAEIVGFTNRCRLVINGEVHNPTVYRSLTAARDMFTRYVAEQKRLGAKGPPPAAGETPQPEPAIDATLPVAVIRPQVLDMATVKGVRLDVQGPQNKPRKVVFWRADRKLGERATWSACHTFLRTLTDNEPRT